jgi:hypothetical protein
MQPTPAGATSQADFGSTTIVIVAANDRYQKLLRLRAIKAQLRDLRAEYEQLEQELFGQAAS